MEERKNETLEEVKEVPQEENQAKASVPQEGNKDRGQRKFQKGNRKSPRQRQREEVKKEFEERVVYINRVSKTVKGGRRMKFSAIVVIGNGKGKYGFAIRKSNEVPEAMKKASEGAHKNLHTVKLVKNDTISHEVIGKFGATRVFLKPAPEGTGIIAGGSVRAILELCGIRNVYSKVYGSRTAINVIRATQEALSSLKDYETVMSLRKGGDEDVK